MMKKKISKSYLTNVIRMLKRVTAHFMLYIESFFIVWSNYYMLVDNPKPIVAIILIYLIFVVTILFNHTVLYCCGHKFLFLVEILILISIYIFQLLI